MSASDAAAKSSSQTVSVKIVIPKAKVKSGRSDVVDLTSDVSATITNPDDEATLSKFNLIHVFDKPWVSTGYTIPLPVRVVVCTGMGMVCHISLTG